jgi:predicted tellurium resistance membrane protein TerC
MALTSDMDQTPQLILMTIAVVLGGLLMIVMADKVSDFLQKNKMYEVLGLFILFIVGIMLLSEGGHIAHLEFFGNKVEPMSKATFYFVIITLVIIDIVQGRYQKNLLAKKEMMDKATEKNEEAL